VHFEERRQGAGPWEEEGGGANGLDGPAGGEDPARDSAASLEQLRTAGQHTLVEQCEVLQHDVAVQRVEGVPPPAQVLAGKALVQHVLLANARGVARESALYVEADEQPHERELHAAGMRGGGLIRQSGERFRRRDVIGRRGGAKGGTEAFGIKGAIQAPGELALELAQLRHGERFRDSRSRHEGRRKPPGGLAAGAQARPASAGETQSRTAASGPAR